MEMPVAFVFSGLRFKLLFTRIENSSFGPIILEINPDHKLIVKLADLVKAKDASDPALDDAAFLLLDQARILEGEPVLDAGAFSKRLSKLMAQGLA